MLIVLSIATAYLADSYLDSLSPEMGDAEYPDESFEAFSERTSTRISKDVRPENIDDSSLMDRLRITNMMILDTASSDFIDLSEGNNQNGKILRGFKVEGCDDIDRGYTQPRFCEELNYYEASLTARLSLMTHSDLNKTFRNISKMEEYENTMERASYYDRKLYSGDGEKKTSLVYQNTSGLYIIGEKTDSVEINENSYSTEVHGEWSYADVDLEQGTYNVSYSNEKHIFKVFSLTSEVYDEGKLLLRDEWETYDYVEISEGDDTYRREIGGNLSIDSSAPEAEIKYMNEKVNITKKVINRDHSENMESSADHLSDLSGLDPDSAEKVVKAGRIYNKFAGIAPFMERLRMQRNR